jgi:hypothetical protein
LKETDDFITRAASRRIDEPAAGVRLLETCNGGERLLSGAAEQRAERRRVIVSATAVDVRLTDRFGRW